MCTNVEDRFIWNLKGTVTQDVLAKTVWIVQLFMAKFRWPNEFANSQMIYAFNLDSALAVVSRKRSGIALSRKSCRRIGNDYADRCFSKVLIKKWQKFCDTVPLRQMGWYNLRLYYLLKDQSFSFHNDKNNPRTFETHLWFCITYFCKEIIKINNNILETNIFGMAKRYQLVNVQNVG